MLPGQIIPSERPGHFMMERWNPLKVLLLLPIFIAGAQERCLIE
jgi:hypothetical protein